MRYRIRAALILCAAGLGAPAAAQDYQVRDANGATQTMASKLNGGVNFPEHVVTDPTGAHALVVTATGAAMVDGSAVTQPISGAVSLAGTLPGFTTEPSVRLDQSGANNGVQVENSVAVTGSFWQATQPVSGTFWQSTQPVSAASLPLPAGAATAANQPTLNGDGGAPAHVTDFPASQAVTGTFWQATQPVSGTFWQTTQPVSAASLPLPSGAAQETGGNLATIAANTASLMKSSGGTVGLAAGVANIGTVSPSGVTTTSAAVTVTTGGSFQSVLAANAARKGCLVQNPIAATETLFVFFGANAGAATNASIGLAPGAAISCNAGPNVLTDNVSVTGATSGHALVVTSQ